jgi:Na+/phosphate symporter
MEVQQPGPVLLVSKDPKVKKAFVSLMMTILIAIGFSFSMIKEIKENLPTLGIFIAAIFFSLYKYVQARKEVERKMLQEGGKS